jgi:CIC family chloride channel protein
LLTPIGGLIIGVIGLRFPEIFGVGYEAINEALRGNLGFGVLVALLAVKMLATGITIATGGSGGVFAPSLFLGAMSGGFIGVIANHLFPAITAAPGAYALVGMGAVVAGATHAPITAILIIFELTYDYQLIVPLMGACIISTLVTMRRGVDISAGRELNVLRSQRVEQVMVAGNAGIAPDLPLAVLLERVTSGAATYFYVTGSDGRLEGVIGPDELRTTLLDADSLRGLVVASDLLRCDVPSVTPEQDLDTVMRIFGGKNREELPVVDSPETRRLVGTITRGHLLEAYSRELQRRDMVLSLAGDISGSAQDEILLGDDHSMAEIALPSRFRDKTLRELDLRQSLGVQVVLVRRRQGASEEQVELVPQPDTRLQLGDAIVVMGPKQALRQLMQA